MGTKLADLVQSALTTGLKAIGVEPKKQTGESGFVKQQTADTGLPQTASAPADTSSGYGGYSYGGGYSRYGGGGGGGGSSSTPADQQKKTQAQLDNTGGNYGQRKKDLDKITQGRKGDLEKTAGDRMGDMDKIAQQQLGNIVQQQEANTALRKQNSANIMKQVNWQPNEQKKQSTLMALRNRIGNAALSSAIQDLAEGMMRVDDMNDVELINAWKQNEDANYSNWFQANQSLIADYNDQLASIEDEYSQFRADYADQMSKLSRDYQDELSQLYSQYWSTMSNVNPELATKKNLQKAAKNASGTSKTAKAVTNAKAVKKAVKTMAKSGTKVSTKGLTGTQKEAAKIVNKAVKDKSNKNAKAVTKAANKAAKAAVTKAKNANKVSVGKDTDQYYLPNVDLRSKVDLTSNLNIAPSAALQKMLVAQQNADSQNPATAAYIRSDKASALGGTIDTSRAANTGFSDNLAAFRRV